MKVVLVGLAMLAAATAYAQSSGGSAGGSGGMSGGGSSTMGGAPSGGADARSRDTGTGSGAGETARVPDLCRGDRCDEIGEPTGTGFGDRGIRRGATDPYDLGDSPVQGGPAVTGPTGRPLDLPHPGPRER